MRDANRRAGLAEHADPADHGAAARIDHAHVPRPRPAVAAHGADRGQQVERFVGHGPEAERPRVHAHGDQPAGRVHAPQARRGRILLVGQQVVARLHRNPGQGLARARALGRGQLEKVARQGRQPHAVVQSPQRAGLAGFLDRGGVDRPHRRPRVRGQLQAALVE